MPVWAVTGKLGAGKTLVAVSRIQKYLMEGRRVATNLDLNLEKLINPWNRKAECLRLPDVPSVGDFSAIGLGYDGKLQGDHKNGLVVLDECARWLNSRNWNDKSRSKLIDYFVHLRKKRWDLILIIQDIEALDKQFRDLYCEHIVYCSRFDRHKIPIIGPLYHFLFDAKLSMPRMHVGNVYYQVGNGQQTHVERWFYRGNDLMAAYNTEQGFDEFTSPGLYQYLTPWHVEGRYVSRIQKYKEYCQGIRFWHLFFAGLLSGGAVVQAFEPDGNEPDRGNWVCNADWEYLFGDCTLTKADVKNMVKQYKAGQQPTKAENVTESEQEPQSHPLDAVFISGSVGVGSQYEYTFVKEGQTFLPYEKGYKIYDGSACSALAVNLEDKQDRRKLTCIDGETL